MSHHEAELCVLCGFTRRQRETRLFPLSLSLFLSVFQYPIPRINPAQFHSYLNLFDADSQSESLIERACRPPRTRGRFASFEVMRLQIDIPSPYIQFTFFFFFFGLIALQYSTVRYSSVRYGTAGETPVDFYASHAPSFSFDPHLNCWS